MPYCQNCGNKHSNVQKYCRTCGSQLSSTLTLSTAPLTSGLSDEIATGVERAHHRILKRKAVAEYSNDSNSFYVGCVAAVAMLQGLSYMGDGKISLLNGQLALILYAGVVIAAIFKVIFDLRYGRSLARSVVEVVLFGVLAYACVFGIFWYLTNNYLHTGKPIFSFPSHLTMTPTAHPAK